MNDIYSISVVIPTYNRREDLDKCLQSISKQRILPNQVIVVDNGSISPQDIISKWDSKFLQQNIEFLYIKNELENGANIARNIGISYSTGFVVSFLDDDLILDNNYYYEILDIFKKYPNANGVQGYNQSASYHPPTTLIEKILDKYHRYFQIPSLFSENGCKILPSLCGTYPYPGISEIQTCEWMSGASAYRRGILDKINWDISLKKYSYNDDIDISYRVFKKYPGTLYMNPHAKYWHKGSLSGRNPPIEIIYVSEVYAFYLFFKIIDYSFKKNFIFIRSRLGRLVLNIFFDCTHFSKDGMINSFHRINALIYAIIHIRKIRLGDLTFFNKTIK